MEREKTKGQGKKKQENTTTTTLQKSPNNSQC